MVSQLSGIEQQPVNRLVTGSNPARGATQNQVLRPDQRKPKRPTHGESHEVPRIMAPRSALPRDISSLRQMIVERERPQRN
jgi:hypothetical protein